MYQNIPIDHTFRYSIHPQSANMVLGVRRHSAASTKSAQADDRSDHITKEDETVVDEEQGNGALAAYRTNQSND